MMRGADKTSLAISQRVKNKRRERGSGERDKMAGGLLPDHSVATGLLNAQLYTKIHDYACHKFLDEFFHFSYFSYLLRTLEN